MGRLSTTECTYLPTYLRSARLWGVVPRFRLRVLGGRSLATPG